LCSASAQGFISDGFNWLMPPFPGTKVHTPEKSGLPSAAFGGCARRLGFPSVVRGIPGVG